MGDKYIISMEYTWELSDQVSLEPIDGLKWSRRSNILCHGDLLINEKAFCERQYLYVLRQKKNR